MSAQTIDLGVVVGPQGATGATGPQGPKGDTGATGADATINGVNALTIAAGANVSLSQSGSTLSIAATDTTYSAATTSANGLMSSADKAKLDGIASGATANVAATAAPLMDGTAAVGTSAAYARGDHVHPTDASRASAADLNSVKTLLQNVILSREASGNPATFSDAAAASVRKLVVTLTPAQAGSGDPSPSNVRAISGVSSVSVTRTGKNLYELAVSSHTDGYVTFTVNKEAGSVNADGGPPDGGYSVAWGRLGTIALPPGDYYVSGGAGQYCAVDIESSSTGSHQSGGGDVAFSVSAYHTLTLYIRAQGTQLNKTVYPMVRLASESDATFSPGHRASVTVPLVDSNNAALTVYGGTLDMTAGKLTVTWGYLASYNGETLPGRWVSDRDVYAAGTSPTTGAQVAYELAPANYQSYNLAAQSLDTLSGSNVIFANSGSVSVEYRADTSVILGG